MNAVNKRSGERRLPACSFRQPAGNIEGVRMSINVASAARSFGKLPNDAGWQPALPGISHLDP